jgi:sigma-E factor negative regulatory protein RseC
MLETRAIVIQIQGREALVESMQGGGCGQCSATDGCSSGKLSQMFCSKPRRFRVDNLTAAKIGDEVQISVADGVLLRSALLLYMLPLALLFIGGLLGSLYGTDTASRDGYAALGAGCGLILGFALAKILAGQVQRVQPVIVNAQ